MRPSASVAGPVWPGHASKREDISGPLSRSLRPSSSIQHSLSLSPHSPLLSAAVISPACPPPPPRRICRASERARAYFDDVAPGAQECRRRYNAMNGRRRTEGGRKGGQLVLPQPCQLWGLLLPASSETVVRARNPRAMTPTGKARRPLLTGRFPQVKIRR